MVFALVKISFNTKGLYTKKENQKDAIEQLVDHIDYLKIKIGTSQIGIGTDLQGFGKYIPEDLNKMDSFDKLEISLDKRGYSKSEIDKIFYKNYIDFMN